MGFKLCRKLAIGVFVALWGGAVLAIGWELRQLGEHPEANILFITAALMILFLPWAFEGGQ